MTAQEQADIHRAEAKLILSEILRISDRRASRALDRAVDCIIGAAILEAAKEEGDKP
jgi:hypothetical protein